MRAEAQQYIDRIDAALALLRQSLDWDRALRRLDELNARVEDPTLWDNAKQAQEVMRERTRLDSAIGGWLRFRAVGRVPFGNRRMAGPARRNQKVLPTL